MKTVCEENMCVGCGACVERCPKKAISLKDSLKAFNAVIAEDNCVNCGACVKVCQRANPIIGRKPIYWQQGWLADSDSRAKSSSGGVATGLMKAFLDKGGYVCGCVLENGHFGYRLTKDLDDLDLFRGSKYVKSSPQKIYAQIAELLKQGEKVLFIGLPCHVAALKRITESYAGENLYTVDLICHGTPSELLLNRFLQEKDICLSSVKSIFFRRKNAYRLSVVMQGEEKEVFLAPEGERDDYMFGFLKGLFFTENCYSCTHARIERISDITIGDSWGSELPKEEIEKGLSIVLCQTERGKALLSDAGMISFSVDLEKALAANHQLQEPMEKNENREKFFSRLNRGKTVGSAVRACYPKVFLKRRVKKLLKRLHLR